METFDVASLQGLHQEITRIVNFKESAAGQVFSPRSDRPPLSPHHHHRVVVNFCVDPDLDALKRKSAELPETLASMASALSDSVGLSRDMRQGILSCITMLMAI